jgi:hypothetical protein
LSYETMMLVAIAGLLADFNLFSARIASRLHKHQ